MSNDVYPVLPGETYPVVRTPNFSTIINESQSGREVRIANYLYPRSMWEIPYSFLMLDDPHLNGDAYAFTFQALYGFFVKHYGAWDSFLYLDPNDNATINTSTSARVPAQIGVGDGTTTQFQIGRLMGGAFEPLFDLNDGAYAHKVYLNAVLTSAYTISNGLITFSSAPGAGVVITADFNYYWRVRFQADSIDFENFAYNLYEIKKVRLYQTRT